MNTRIVSSLITVAVAAVASLSALGAHAEGAYVGGSLAAPDYRSDVNGYGGDGGGHGVGLKAYGGYQFNPNFAVEGGIVDLGRSKDIGGTAKARGAYVDAIGSVDVAPQWKLYGSAGAAYARFHTPDGSDNSPAVKLGAGVEYALTSNTALRLGYDHYHFTDAYDSKPNVGQASFGVKFSF